MTNIDSDYVSNLWKHFLRHSTAKAIDYVTALNACFRDDIIKSHPKIQYVANMSKRSIYDAVDRWFSDIKNLGIAEFVLESSKDIFISLTTNIEDYCPSSRKTTTTEEGSL